MLQFLSDLDSKFVDDARNRLTDAQAFLTDANNRLLAARAVALSAHYRALKVKTDMHEVRRLS
jgi:hypothetical protein